MGYFNVEELPAVYEQDILEGKFREMQKGDPVAKNEIIEHNLSLVISIAKQFNNIKVDINYDIEDLISIGTIGLIKAVNTFNLDKDIHFATYASRCIKNEIIMFLRKIKRHTKHISLNTPIKGTKIITDLVIADSLIDIDSDYAIKYETQIMYNEIRNFIIELPKKRKIYNNNVFWFYRRYQTDSRTNC